MMSGGGIPNPFGVSSFVKRNNFFEKLVFNRLKKACIVIGGIKIHLKP